MCHFYIQLEELASKSYIILFLRDYSSYPVCLANELEKLKSVHITNDKKLY